MNLKSQKFLIFNDYNNVISYFLTNIFDIPERRICSYALILSVIIALQYYRLTIFC